MSTNPFNDLPPPQPISALWAVRALLAFPDKHMIDDCFESLERCVKGFCNLDEPSDSDPANRLLMLEKVLSASIKPCIPHPIEDNVRTFSQIVRLDFFECRVLELAATLIEDVWLYIFCEKLPVPHRWRAIYIINVMLDIGYVETAQALSATCGLHLCGLFKPVAGDKATISQLLAMDSDEAFTFCQHQFSPFELLHETAQLTTTPKLHPLDFSHLRPTVEVLKGYIKHQMKLGSRGANILLYGQAGTGKSELIQSIMRTANRRLLEVPFVNNRLEVLEPRNRLNSFLRAQACIKPSHTVLVFDHFEEIFNAIPTIVDGDASEGCKLQTGWLYRLMEYSPIPTIWLTNDITNLPTGFMSRMDAVFEIRPPSSTWRTSMLHRLRRSRQLNINTEIATDMGGLTPGVMDRAIQTAALFEDTEDDAKATRVLKFLVTNFQKANSNGSDHKENKHE